MWWGHNDAGQVGFGTCCHARLAREQETDLVTDAKQEIEFTYEFLRWIRAM